MLRNNRPSDRTMVIVAVGALALGLTACADQDPTAAPTGQPTTFGVYDGETMQETFFVPVATTEPGDFKEPTYEPTELAVGECQEGWVQITTGNPDLIPAYLRYERADTGERVTFVPDVSEGTPPPIKGE